MKVDYLNFNDSILQTLVFKILDHYFPQQVAFRFKSKREKEAKCDESFHVGFWLETETNAVRSSKLN